MAKTTQKEETGEAAEFAGEQSKGELAVQQTGGALANYDFGGDAGTGLEDVGRDDIKMPFFTLLQSNSPQVEEGVKQLPNAKAGMFMDSVSQELYDGKLGLLMVPALRARNIVEYTPRDLGGGFLGAHDPADPAIVKLMEDHNRKLNRKPTDPVFGKMSTTTKFSSDGKPLDGTEFIDTRYLFAVLQPCQMAEDGVNRLLVGNPFWAMLAFKSTQIDKHKTLVSRAFKFQYPNGRGGTVNPPLWAHRWLLQSAPETKKGKTFQGFKMTLFAKNPDGSEAPKEASVMRMDDPLYVEAKKLYEAMTSGAVKADFSQQAAAGGADDDLAGAGGDDDTDIPM